MKVLIKETELDYVSDYPEGWVYSSGDYFKYPVQIGIYKCFLKRFKVKTPDNILGWGLLNSLKGKHAPGLPRIHDIKKTVEGSKDVYYVFYEFIDGTTIDNLIKINVELNLEKLASGLLKALESLSKYEYWFTDFCEKNIFRDKMGNFFLIDIDSACSFKTAPDNDLDGSKDYWILVLKFYEFLTGKKENLADFNGISLNYMQLMFLVLRCRLNQLKGKERTNYYQAVYDELPEIFNSIDPLIKLSFEEIIKLRGTNINEESVSKMRDLIFNKILNYDPEVGQTKIIQNSTGQKTTLISSFTATKFTIKEEEQFCLNWEVKDVDEIKLHKNGAYYKNLNKNKNSLTLSKVFDGKPDKIRYQLVAIKGSQEERSKLVEISLKQTFPNLYRFIIALILLIIVFILISQSREKGRIIIEPFSPASGNVSDSLIAVNMLGKIDLTYEDNNILSRLFWGNKRTCTFNNSSHYLIDSVVFDFSAKKGNERHTFVNKEQKFQFRDSFESDITVGQNISARIKTVYFNFKRGKGI